MVQKVCENAEETSMKLKSSIWGNVGKSKERLFQQSRTKLIFV